MHGAVPQGSGDALAGARACTWSGAGLAGLQVARVRAPARQAARSFSFLLRRLLWRAALFLLMMPLLVMLSMTGTAIL